MISLLDPRPRIEAGFRTILSGSATPPDWIKALEQGTDEGYFGPGSEVWTVHGDLATLIGGIRALLMQALHPAAVTGVDQHSTYREDPLGRLAGTTRWLTVTTFADRAGADREAARVRGMHRRVRGTYLDAQGEEHDYRASDERLLAWVHAAFTDSFLTTHQIFGQGLSEQGADEYVRTWAKSAELIGLTRTPRSVAELAAEIEGFRPDLARTPQTVRTLAFLRNPPLPLAARPAYQVLFAGAVSTLDPEHRKLLGLISWGSIGPRLSTQALLNSLKLVLRQGPPAAAAARSRVAALDDPH